ncbi:MAG: hypothetical protein ACLQFR_30850 [Streptosporangiaceae bacterium]
MLVSGYIGRAADQVIITDAVLLVEDERKLRAPMHSYLELAGHAALSAESGAAAITVAATTTPGSIGLDLGHPDILGETVALQVRSASSGPVIDESRRMARAEIDPANCEMVQTVLGGSYRLGVTADG